MTLRNKKSKSRRRSSMKIPIAPILGVAAGCFAAPSGWATPFDAAIKGDFTACFKTLMRNYLFFNMDTGTVDLVNSGVGMKAAILGGAVHKAAGFVGINRALGRARLPFSL